MQCIRFRLRRQTDFPHQYAREGLRIIGRCEQRDSNECRQSSCSRVRITGTSLFQNQFGNVQEETLALCPPLNRQLLTPRQNDIGGGTSRQITWNCRLNVNARFHGAPGSRYRLNKNAGVLIKAQTTSWAAVSRLLRSWDSLFFASACNCNNRPSGGSG